MQPTGGKESAGVGKAGSGSTPRSMTAGWNVRELLKARCLVTFLPSDGRTALRLA